jgi:glucose/arabinose dehydrogenase
MRSWVVVVCLSAVAVVAGAQVPAGGAGSALPPVRFELVGKVEERPVLVTHDNAGRTFVVEQPGRIWQIVNGKIREDKPYLDVSEQIYAAGECGLLGLAFHPQFAQNGRFYVNFTADKIPPQEVKVGNKTITKRTLKTVVAEYEVDPKAESVDANKRRPVIEIDQPYENHNGGMIAFGLDGMLYIGMGDGGNQRDPHKNGQNLGTLLAKMLRIDVAPREGYAVPPDNPFVSQAGARPEIWAYGLRNPWRFSFDRQTGLCYAADVGEDRWEEIDVITKGANYGWSLREGAYPFNRQKLAKGEKPPTAPPDDHPGFADAIKVYWHDLGMSVTGGNVYRGKAIPALQGWYLYADYSKGTFWGLKYDGEKVTAEGTLKITNEKEVRPILPSGFGEDGDGEVYVCSHQDGKVWKIVAGK